MYKSFFALKENPFNVNPDPRYLFLTKQIEEALSGLMYGIQTRKGFITLTGEVGTGKTTLVNRLLDWLHLRRTKTAFLFNSRMNTNQLFDFIMAEFDIPCDNKSKSQQLMKLNHWLLERYRAGETAVLIVDEAQNLTFPVLEEIRLLTNLETSQQKLLQIVLMGQPELELILDSPQLRQLKQRVALRCQLQPLDEAQTRAYVLSRLERAGAPPGPPIFADEALSKLYEYSRGIPRIINNLCENSMVNAFAREQRPVTPEMISEVAADFRLTTSSLPEEVPLPVAAPEENGESLLRSLFRLLRTMDNQTLENEKTVPTAAGRRV